MIDNTHNSFVAIWLREHYNDLMIKKFEAEKEQQIKEMLENIEQANLLLEEKKQKKLKEVGANGRTDQEEGGETQEGANTHT